ncbi:MAG: hypothetical protein Q9167_000320 [Letrouitia subvulpina]
MAPTLDPRSQLTDHASATASSGWNKCMAKPYCKWPAIIGIVLAVLVALTALYCCCRCLSCCCCDCLSGGRYRRQTKHKYADLSEQPPYAYGHARDPAAGTGREDPPRYARFEQPKKQQQRQNQDSLPDMPMWDQAKERRVYDDDHDDDGDMALRKETGGGGGVELRKLDTSAVHEQRAPMLVHQERLPAAPGPYAEMDDPSYRRVHREEEVEEEEDVGRAAALVYRSYASPKEYKAYAPYAPQGQRDV